MKSWATLFLTPFTRYKIFDLECLDKTIFRFLANAGICEVSVVLSRTADNAIGESSAISKLGV